MPTHYGHTPGSFNADRIRLLAGPGGAAKATGRTGTPAFGNAAVGRALLNSATSRARQASGTTPASNKRRPPIFGSAEGRAFLHSASSQYRQSDVGAARLQLQRQTTDLRQQLQRQTTDLSTGGDPFAGRTLLSGSAGGSADGLITSENYEGPRYLNGVDRGPKQSVTRYARPTSAPATAPEPFQFNTALGSDTPLQFNTPTPGAAAPAPATAPEPFQFNTALGSDTPLQFDTPNPVARAASTPTLPTINTPYRSTAPDPGSPATLARPEAPNVDPLTLPEARQRTVANRSQDLGHLQSARSRRSVRGPRGSFNMADTARRTLLGSL